jgi:hypothetical protein
MMLRYAIFSLCRAHFVNGCKPKLNFLQNLSRQWWTTSPEDTAARIAVFWRFLQNLSRQWWTTSSEDTAARIAVFWRCYRGIRNFINYAIGYCLESAIAVSFEEGSLQKQQPTREEPINFGLTSASGSITCSISTLYCSYSYSY